MSWVLTNFGLDQQRKKRERVLELSLGREDEVLNYLNTLPQKTDEVREVYSDQNSDEVRERVSLFDYEESEKAFKEKYGDVNPLKTDEVRGFRLRESDEKPDEVHAAWGRHSPSVNIRFGKDLCGWKPLPHQISAGRKTLIDEAIAWLKVENYSHTASNCLVTHFTRTGVIEELTPDQKIKAFATLFHISKEESHDLYYGNFTRWGQPDFSWERDKEKFKRGISSITSDIMVKVLEGLKKQYEVCK